MKYESNTDIQGGKHRSFALGTLFGLGMLFATSAATAGVIFQDDFNSGNLSKKLNGVTVWTNSSSSHVYPGATGPSTITVKPEAQAGDYSVRALYAGSPDLSADGRPELRFNLGGKYSELWISFRVYVPNNYYHRTPTGTGNNKFLMLSNGNGMFVDFERWPTSDGAGRFSMQWSRQGVNQGWIDPEDGGLPRWSFGAADDRGKWHSYVFHYRTATSARNNGLVEVWKNGTLVQRVTNLDNYTPDANYYSQGYFFGAANSGFNTDTELRLDDVTFSTTPPLRAPRWMP